MTNYTIATYDERTFTIDEKNGLALIDKWTNAPKAFPVNLGSEAISSGLIKSITPNQLPEADRPTSWLDDAKAIAAGKQCRGQYSIQLEINRIARHEYPNEWATKIQDKAWREEIRRTLLATTDQWCDHKTGTCSCDPNFKSTFKRHATV